MNDRLRSPAVIGGAAAAAVAIIALVVAMCSGNGDEPSGTTTAGASTTTAVPSTTSAPSTTTSDLSTTTTTAGGAGAGTPAPSTTAAPTTAPSTTSPTTTTAAPPTTAPPTTYPPSEEPDGPFVRIGNDYFPFTQTECLIYDGLDAVVNGPGEAPDGTPVHVSLTGPALRVDIGTQDPLEPMDDHWGAGEDYGGELEVTIDVWHVTATGTIVHATTGGEADLEFEAECSF